MPPPPGNCALAIEQHRGAGETSEIAESNADKGVAERERIEALVATSRAETDRALARMRDLQIRCDEAERRSQLAQLLCERQVNALKQLAEENASLLGLLSGLPSLRSAVANGTVPPKPRFARASSRTLIPMEPLTGSTSAPRHARVPDGGLGGARTLPAASWLGKDLNVPSGSHP